ncbi:MAG: hypothetical protein H7Y86_12480 [Rhizobacter sp.]|nr:hypothetical protein [Ferruginibacter sp.]
MNAFLQFPTDQNGSSNNSLSGNIISGISFLREGISDAIDKTGEHISNHIVHPVNNFLKDLTHMDHEFKKVQEAENEFRLCLNGKYMTANDILQMPMEENY